MSAPPERRTATYGLKPLADMAGAVTRVQLGRRGFDQATMVAEWAAVVGPQLAGMTSPLKIVRPRGEKGGDGVLHVRVASGALALELQHLEPLIVERVNGHFGYRAIGRVALSQGPLPPRRAKRGAPTGPAAPPPPPAQAVERSLAAVEDPELKRALAGLARFVLAPR